MPVTFNKKTSFKKKRKKKVLWEVFHMNENAPLRFFFSPHLIILYTRQDQKVCIFFTILFALMLDELYATQQIHQEEQALEIKETIFIRIQWTYLLNYIKQTHHKRYGDDRELTLPFFRCSPSRLPST